MSKPPPLDIVDDRDPITRARESYPPPDERCPQCAEAAAFLDQLAERIDGALHISVVADAPSGCRAMAAKLRGET